MRTVFLCAFALISASLANAANVEAERYISSQGVEIIHNRGYKPASEEKITSEATQKNSQRIAPASKTISPAIGMSSAQDSKMRISTSEQKVMDRDRLAILNQELMTEANTFQTKWKALHAPNLKSSMSEEEAANLRLSVAEHEKNIRALSAEIKRVQSVK